MLNLFSESHRWKNQVEGSESDLERLFVTSTIGMALLDEGGRFLSANQAFCRTLGYSENELLNMRSGQLLTFAQGKRDNVSRLFDKSNQLSWQAEQVLLRRDQSSMPARVWISSLKEEQFHDSLSLMIVEDITEQREAEDELNKRKAEIESLASQLIQSQEMERKRLARELHDDIGQRLSLVASEVALMACQSSKEKTVATDRLDNLREELDNLCTDIHEISHDLHSFKLQQSKRADRLWPEIGSAMKIPRRLGCLAIGGKGKPQPQELYSFRRRRKTDSCFEFRNCRIQLSAL